MLSSSPASTSPSTEEMYRAYSIGTMLQNLMPPLSIEAATVYKDSIILGMKQGQLLTIRISEHSSAKEETPYTISKSNTTKNFLKKPITQLAAVEEHELLVCLSDGLVSVYGVADHYPLVQKIEKCRPARVFALCTKRVEVHTDGSNDDRTEKNSTLLKMCIAVKRKLHVFYWKPKCREFWEHPHDHVLPDEPRTLIWSSDDHLIVGYKLGYVLLRANQSGKLTELFSIPRPEPLVARLRNNDFGMVLEKQVILVGPTGSPTQKFSINLSDVPISIVYDYPYLLALSTAAVEVHTISPRLSIQKIKVPQHSRALALVVWKSGAVFVVSTNHLYCLARTPVSDQMQACKEAKQFPLALKLTNLLDAPDEEKTLCKFHIQNLLAFNDFVNGNFQKAFNLFEEIHTDPLHVIGLFPILLKEQYRKLLLYPAPIPDLGDKLENGLTLLIEYLKASRRVIISQPGESVKVGGILEGTNAVRPKKQLLQIIDTTILKSYLQTNPDLVATLLRFRDNHCHLEESEAALQKHQMFAELIILYEQKGEHRKALQLLSEQALVPSSPLHGHERTIAYLQRLPVKHFDLILEYAKWVIDAFPDDGLKIFTEGNCGREQLPRDHVIQFLTNESPALVLSYLEHVVLVWNDNNILFHNMLIHKYREQILRMADDDLSDPLVMSLRDKLIHFLRTSNRYTVASFPQFFLNDKLYLECAIVMGKLGRHQDALTIYIHVLGDLARAEEYCLDQYMRNKASDRDVFIILLSLYTTPAEICLKALDISAPASALRTPDIMKVLELLDRHVDKLDPLRAIEMLPADIPLQKLVPFVIRLLDRQSTYLSRLRLHQALSLTDNLSAKRLKFELEKFFVTIDDLKLCDFCHRKINRSVFVHTEVGQIVHYACHNQALHDEDTVEY